MAEARKCDRCGKYYELREMNALESFAAACLPIFRQRTESNCITVIESLLDLCPACSKSLKKWVKGAEKADGK